MKPHPLTLIPHSQHSSFSLSSHSSLAFLSRSPPLRPAASYSSLSLNPVTVSVSPSPVPLSHLITRGSWSTGRGSLVSACDLSDSHSVGLLLTGHRGICEV
ncbi:hypothetical protein K1719_043265 [Acacia pycnantha]|nr:hypothetical protein K1719_043265 [Acacia pycnantha]